MAAISNISHQHTVVKTPFWTTATIQKTALCACAILLALAAVATFFLLPTPLHFCAIALAAGSLSALYGAYALIDYQNPRVKKRVQQMEFSDVFKAYNPKKLVRYGVISEEHKDKLASLNKEEKKIRASCKTESARKIAASQINDLSVDYYKYKTRLGGEWVNLKGD